MPLAVFGGTFDPPHNGHLALCLFARERLCIERLILSVSNNPFKQKSVTGDHHRKKMTELLAAEINATGCCCEVDSWELEHQSPSYTIDLLNHIRDLYPHERIMLLVGEDSYGEMASWKNAEILVTLCDIVVFRRLSANKPVPVFPLNGAKEIIDFDSAVSSTELRQRLAAGESVTRYLPCSINHYITKHGLYC